MQIALSGWMEVSDWVRQGGSLLGTNRSGDDDDDDDDEEEEEEEDSDDDLMMMMKIR